jgi:hypothetical protein
MRLTVARLLWKFDWQFITKTRDEPEFAMVYRSLLMVKATSRQNELSVKLEK